MTKGREKRRQTAFLSSLLARADDDEELPAHCVERDFTMVFFLEIRL